MSARELRRVEVLAQVHRGRMKLVEAAELTGVSYRQMKRLHRRYREGGARSLVHGNRGKPSPRAKPEAERKRALELVRERYGGARGERLGPTLAAEQLAGEHGMKVSAETLRRWMLRAGLWSRERRRREHRRRRERRAHFGELVQMDGSPHAWLEKRGPRACLVGMVDDATGYGGGRFEAEETIWAAADGLRAWVEKHGIPHALYTDWKNTYVRRATSAEALRGEEPLTQFGRMCARLGIVIIAAGSPQAKGRIERAHGTHQDRLVKKMRLLGIGDYAAANAYLEASYWAEHNARYAVAPRSPTDYHRPLPRGMKLDEVFSLHTQRRVSEDWVVSYRNRLLQIAAGQGVRPRQTVIVEEQRSGHLRLLVREKELRWVEIATRPPKPPKPLPLARPNRHRPLPANHPWRRMMAYSAQVALAKRERRNAAVEMTLGGKAKPLAFPPSLDPAARDPHSHGTTAGL